MGECKKQLEINTQLQFSKRSVCKSMVTRWMESSHFSVHNGCEEWQAWWSHISSELIVWCRRFQLAHSKTTPKNVYFSGRAMIMVSLVWLLRGCGAMCPTECGAWPVSGWATGWAICSLVPLYFTFLLRFPVRWPPCIVSAFVQTL